MSRHRLGRWMVGGRVLLVLTACLGSACLDISESEKSKTDAASGGHFGIDGSSGFPGSGGIPPDASAEACSACSGSGCTCVAPAPPGWSYATFAIAASESICPSGFDSPIKLGDTLTDPGCASCTCGAVQGDCVAHATGFPQAGCNGTPVFEKDTAGQCVASGTAQSVLLELKIGGGTCQPNADPLVAGYTNTATVCRAVVDASCPCVKAAATPFDSQICVESDTDGDASCPLGFPSKHAFGNGIEDSRACTGCSCDPAINVTCQASAGGYCGPNCGGCVGGSVSLICHDTASPESWFVDGQPKTGSCNASGTPTSTGTLAPKTVRVVCCTGK